MMINIIILALLASVSASVVNSTSHGAIVPGAYIVQFELGHASVDEFYQTLQAHNISSISRQRFQASPFPGTSFHLTSDRTADLDQISSLPQVKAISPVRIYERLIPNIKELQHANEQPRKFKRDVASSITGSNSTITAHLMTGVDKLLQEGLTGKGIKIAIVDSGIDYTHPALGAGFGPGYKVAFGTDLVGDNYYGVNTPIPDNDPRDCYGHGTHVAGIIGSENDPYLLGVAPGATLGIYKVFGCYESKVASDVLISAFTMAHNDGADIITASLGFSNGWPEEAFSAAVGAIVSAGTTCTLAAGNDGSKGMFLSASAASGTDVTSVGSIENTNVPEVLNAASWVSANKTTHPFGYNLAAGNFGNVSAFLWADTYDMTVVDDGCTGFNSSVDLTGKIALIRRGTCTFDTKVQSALAAGSSYVLFYNNIPGTEAVLVENPEVVGAAMVNQDVGAQWINLLASGQAVKASFSTDSGLYLITPGTPNTKNPGTVNTFSTLGLANDNTIKPVVSAPGGSILSTYLTSMGGYTVMSGTSMATPFIAGVVALYLEAKGKSTTPQEINAALAASSNPVKYNDGATTYPYYAPVPQQGAGMVNAYQMIHGSTKISKANLALNDTVNFNKDTYFDLTNTGSVRRTYNLSHEPAANMYAFESSSSVEFATFPVPIDIQYSTATISPLAVVLEPGQEQRIQVTIEPNPKLNGVQVPIYSGFIKVSSDVETVHIPYAGVAANMDNITILLPKSNFYSSYGSTPPVTYNGTQVRAFTPKVPLIYYFTNIWPTALARVDVVGVNVTNTVTFSSLEAVGSVPNFPVKWLGRSSGVNAPFNGTLADGSKVKSGVYKFVLRLAKALGDFEKGEYEEYDSDLFYMNMN